MLLEEVEKELDEVPTPEAPLRQAPGLGARAQAIPVIPSFRISSFPSLLLLLLLFAEVFVTLFLGAAKLVGTSTLFSNALNTWFGDLPY